MNLVVLMGNLGGDPEARVTGNGTSVCNFNIATREHFLGKDGQKSETTTWHRIVVWGKQADLCTKYLSKGSQALITGKLQTREWDGKDGQKNRTTEIVASDVRFIGAKKESMPTISTSSTEINNDSIPF